MGAIERACKVIEIDCVLRCSRNMREIPRAAREDDEVGGALLRETSKIPVLVIRHRTCSVYFSCISLEKCA